MQMKGDRRSSRELSSMTVYGISKNNYTFSYFDNFL